MVLGPAAAHTAPENVFFKSYAAIDNDTFSNPRFVINNGQLAVDVYWSNCDGRDWPEGVWIEVRPLDAQGEESGPWSRSLFFNWGFFTAADCQTIRPVHKDDASIQNFQASSVGLYEFQYVGASTGTVFARAKNTMLGEPPEAPSDLELSSVARDEATIQWVDNSSTEESFQIQRTGGNGVWNTVATRPADSTNTTDRGLTPGQTYTYRVRATNPYGSSDWSNELEVTPGCDQDPDCDGLDNNDENELGTNTHKPDTDGDGLLDPWEAPAELNGEDIENSGFTENTLPELGPAVVRRDDVFGDYSGGVCESADGEWRFSGQVRCLNEPPDPLHKDVYLEIDWQDCTVGDGCPDGDDMHHAPNLAGLQMVVAKFADAPVSNPDGTTGVNLRLLIDESIPHEPNCDQSVSALREPYFGTEDQRSRANGDSILISKERAVRYVWSGHSSQSEAVGGCPTPDPHLLLATGWGLRPLELYDWSPYGDANVGGRDILITLGPVWSCPSQIEFLEMTQCYRAYSGTGFPGTGHPIYQGTAPGIFPSSVDDSNGTNLPLPYPVARLLGLRENEGMQQLWARTLMHLLGHSLGLATDSEVGNAPDAPAVDGNGDGVNEMRGLDDYSSWADLRWAPDGIGTASTELWPRYDFLVGQDLDGDGVLEGEDNCPGIANPNTVFGYQSDADFDKWGDACDPDNDGDSMNETASVPARVDPHPLDTDNDGLRNHNDLDDEGDGVPDSIDNCDVIGNTAQANHDGDSFGNACDGDDDGGGQPDELERRYGLNPLDASDDASLSL